MKLHHTGWIVKDIDTFEKQMLHSGFVHRVTDPVQQAELAVYENFGDSLIELIQPLNENAFTWESLQKNGNHFHHYCYEVNSVDEMNALAAEKRLLLFKGPLEAILFDGKHVYFFINRNRNIVEFIIDPK